MLSRGTIHVLIVTSNSEFSHHVAAELEGTAVAVTVAASPHVLDDATCDVLLVELGIGDWQSARVRMAASVIAFSENADSSMVSSALAEGADDVVCRTDRPHEVAARVRAVARRHRTAPEPATALGTQAAPVLRAGDVELDPASRAVLVGGQPVRLSRRQFDLLEYFLANAGLVLTRSSLLGRVWGRTESLDTNAVEVQVRRLRELIEDDPSQPTRLRTIRGVGYLYQRDPPGT